MGLSTFAFAVAHIETALELANIIRPSTIPLPFIIRSAHNIADIILKKATDSKFMTLILTQAYILLEAAMSRHSFEGKVRIFVKLNNHSDKAICAVRFCQNLNLPYF